MDRLTAAGVQLLYTDTSDGNDTVLLSSDCQSMTFSQATGAPQPTPTPTASTGVTPTSVSVGGPGSIFVTEFMPNPAAVGDTAGEWFEVYNPSPDSAIDINGWTIKDLGSNAHLINNGGPLLVPPLGFLVLARNSDPAANGGVTVDYQTSGFALANAGDEIVLVDGTGMVIDTVIYTSATVFEGAPTTLNPTTFDAASNDSAANWCRGTTALPGGDKGTPGLLNDAC